MLPDWEMTLSGPGSGRRVTKPTAFRRALVQSTPMQLGPTRVTPPSSAARGELVLQRRAFVAGLGEAGGDDDRRGHSVAAALLDDRRRRRAAERDR